MDDVMVAFADGDEGLVGDDMEESETRLPNLSGLALYHDDDAAAAAADDDDAVAAIVPMTRIVPIAGEFPGELVGNEEAEMKAAQAVVACALQSGTLSLDELLDKVSKTTEVSVASMVSKHTEMHSDKDGPFQAMIASFSMASYGGGGVGVAIQFLESGYAASIVGRGRGDYILVDHHPRDPATGGMPKGFGNGRPIAIHSNMVIPLSQYLTRTYGQVTPIRYRATFLVPKVSKGKEEEDEDMCCHQTPTAEKKDSAPVSVAAQQQQQPPSVLPPPPTTKTDDIMTAVHSDEEEPSSEGGKRKRVQTSAVIVKSESDESDEKKAKTPPPAAAAAAAAVGKAKKSDSVPTVVVKKAAPPSAAGGGGGAKPKSVATAPIATEAKATRSSSSAAAAAKTAPAATAATTATASKGKE